MGEDILRMEQRPVAKQSRRRLPTSPLPLLQWGRHTSISNTTSQLGRTKSPHPPSELVPKTTYSYSVVVPNMCTCETGIPQIRHIFEIVLWALLWLMRLIQSDVVCSHGDERVDGHGSVLLLWWFCGRFWCCRYGSCRWMREVGSWEQKLT